MKSKTPAYRPRKTRNQWRAHIAEYDNAGLPVTEFCQRHDLSQQSLLKWRSVFRAEIRKANTPFVEITPTVADSPETSTSNAWDVELILAPGVTLRIRTSA